MRLVLLPATIFLLLAIGAPPLAAAPLGTAPALASWSIARAMAAARTKDASVPLDAETLRRAQLASFETDWAAVVGGSVRASR